MNAADLNLGTCRCYWMWYVGQVLLNSAVVRLQWGGGGRAALSVRVGVGSPLMGQPLCRFGSRRSGALESEGK